MSDTPVVYHNMTIYARRVSADRQYEDLVQVPGVGYGLFDPVAGLWRQHCSENEALIMLQNWQHQVRPLGPSRLPSSEILTAGEQWLART